MRIYMNYYQVHLIMQKEDKTFLLLLIDILTIHLDAFILVKYLVIQKEITFKSVINNILFLNHIKEARNLALEEICMQFLLQVNMQMAQEETFHSEI